MPTLKEQAQTLEVKRTELAQLFDAHKVEGKPDEFKGTLPIQEVRDRNAELTKLGEEYDAAKTASDVFQKNQDEIKRLHSPNRHWEHPKGGVEEPGTNVKSAGDLFTESEMYQARKSAGSLNSKLNPYTVAVEKIGLKSLFVTTAGFAPFVTRGPRVELTPQRQPVVADLIPQDDTAEPGVRYMEEVLFVPSAAAVPEGGVKPEAQLQYAERNITMSKIAVTLPISDEQLADVPQVRALINNRLTLMIQFEEERELLQGSGTNPEMLGFLNKPGVLNQPKGTMDIFTALLTGMTRVQDTVGFANVTGIIQNPLDYLAMRTKQDSTGRFILGDPNEEGPARIWGVNIVKTIAIPQNTALMGDFLMYSHISRREGLRFDVGYVNDQFIRNMQTILMEMRECLEIYRPSAFCTVTGQP